MTVISTAQAPKGAARAAERPQAVAKAGAPGGGGARSAEAAVFERFATVYQYHADGTGSELDTARVHIQSAAGLGNYLVLRIPYTAGTQRVEFVSVRVHKPDGTVVDTPPSDAQDQTTALAQAAPQFSDVHVALLPVRGLAVGDRLETQVRVVFTTPEPGNAFWGAERLDRGGPVLERTLEVHVPMGVPLQVSSPGAAPNVTEADGERVYRWTGGADPSGATGKPLQSTPPVAWSTFASWAAMGNWYRNLSAASTAVTLQVKAKADAVCFGLTTPRARIEALYAFVSKEIRSIDVPLGQGPWAPHAADEVLSNQFGDSKDKAGLLVALLRAEGVAASLALSPVRQDAAPGVPVPNEFGQVVAVAEDPSRGSVWLDSLPEVAQPGELEYAMRGRQALVIPATGEPALHETPVDLPFAASVRFEAKGQLNRDGQLQAHVDLQLRGDQELRWRQVLHNAGPAQWDHAAEALLHAEGLRGEVSNTTAEALDDPGTPLHLSFELSESSFGDWENFRIGPEEPALALPFAERKSSPGEAIPLGGKRTETAISRLELPAGFSADLPAAVHLHTDFADLDASSRLETQGSAVTLVSERMWNVKQGTLTADQWPAYRAFLDRVAESGAWVQLTSAGGAGEHRPPAAGEDNPKAAELVAQAGEAIDRGDRQGAMARLDQAKAINPRQAFLWSSYGVLARQQGKLQEAIEDEEREVGAHPEEAAVSHRLAGDLLGAGQGARAVAVLKAALAQNPHDSRTVLLLGDLQAQSDLPTAETTLRAGLADAPDSLEMKLALGRVLLREGKRDEGAALLTAVATGSQAPGELNDAAFTLADAGLNLRVAEQASRRCVQMLNTESARGEVRGTPAAELRQTLAVVSSWDTYGWVLFKEGLTTEAEPWLRAAWQDGFGAESGRHLVQLLQKQGKAAEAATVSRLAAEMESAAPAAAEPGSVAAQPGGGEGYAGARAERTFPVARPAGVGSATARFELEYTANTAGARFLSGDQALAGLVSSLPRINTHTLIPTGSPVRLYRRGVVRCGGAGAACSLEILPARAALAN